MFEGVLFDMLSFYFTRFKSIPVCVLDLMTIYKLLIAYKSPVGPQP